MQKINKNNNLMFSVLFFLLGILFLLTPLEALARNMTQVIYSFPALLKFYNSMIVWFDLLCTLAAGFTILQIIVSHDQKIVSGAYKYLSIIAITFVIFNLMGPILNYVNNAIISSGGLFHYDYESGNVVSGTLFSNVTNILTKLQTNKII